ncbi:MAG TPA: excinuclease ABC subunit UvrA [Candidatus Xenobia bacterium]
MSLNKLIVKGAREHNLKNIDVELPRESLICITGLSGSGKSSLAFDTIYAEGQRRYVESLSAYARQFLGQMEKPDVDYIEGLSPAISIDQKGASRNPRSTVATVTEIYDYLRLLFARVGKPHCPQCDRPIEPQTIDQMVDQILALPNGTKFAILAPLVRGRKGEYHKLFDEVRQKGYTRVRVDGSMYQLDETIPLDKNKKHTIEVVVDRLKQTEGLRRRVADSLETTLKMSGGLATIQVEDGPELIFSQQMACSHCQVSFEELAPRLFSFNSPYGACPECVGLGYRMEIDPELVMPDPSVSVNEGAIVAWGGPKSSFRFHAAESWFWHRLMQVSHRARIDLDKPFSKLKPEHQDLILYGTHQSVETKPTGNGLAGAVAAKKSHGYGRHHGRRQKREGAHWDFEFEGAIPNLERRYKESDSEHIKEEIARYMTNRECPACRGSRLKPLALAVRVGGESIAEVTALSIRQCQAFFEGLKLTAREQHIAVQILKEIKARLRFLLDVGLDYLTLNRNAGSLSGGEAQRIRLATQIGSSLVGVLYILDEPSIGLHQRDNDRLLATLKMLRDLGNTVIVVEHDEDTMRAADWLLDIGPGAGRHGGRVVAEGPPKKVMATEASVTGAYLSGRLQIAVPSERRSGNGKVLRVEGCRENNLQKLNVDIPLGQFVCVTGVSGSGKSTLVNDILYRALAQHFHQATTKPGAFDRLVGTEFLDKVIEIDQSAIGRTPRSNPATYTGVFDPIRTVFAAVPEARMRGYEAGRFSFNIRGGRCEACQGQGILQIEMHFLPDVYVPCEQCKGTRYNRETLEVLFKGKSIAEVLELTVEEGVEFFQHLPKIARKLQTLHDVGLDYIHLGQPATTLSGGEAQRVKLATELSRVATGKTLYLLDEPTTGLHFQDVSKLLEVLQRLVDAGNTVLVIEHNLDVIKCADHIIDLGPEGGDGGGRIVVAGTPEEVAAHPDSYTGHFLRRLLPVTPVEVRKPVARRSRRLVKV